MEANPDSRVTVVDTIEELFDLVLEGAKAIEYWLEINADENLELMIQATAKALEKYKAAGLLEYSDLKSDDSSRAISVHVLLNEPAFTNIVYANMSDINDEAITKYLHETRYASGIKPDAIYTCSLSVSTTTPEIYLSWNGGQELLYRFENMDSPRYEFFRYVTQNPDVIHTLEAIKRDAIVPQSVSKLHEYFSKTFLKGLLRQKFVIRSEKERVGIKSSAQISGQELILIIRSALESLSSSQRRHRDAKNSKYAEKLSRLL